MEPVLLVLGGGAVVAAALHVRTRFQHARSDRAFWKRVRRCSAAATAALPPRTSQTGSISDPFARVLHPGST